MGGIQAEEGEEDAVGKIDEVLVNAESGTLRWCALEFQAVYFSGKSMENDFKAMRDWTGPGVPFPAVQRRPDFRSSGPKRLFTTGCSQALAGPLLGCVPNEPLLVLFQWGPDAKTGGSGQGALAGVAVKREKPGAAHAYRRRNQYKVVATWPEARRKAAGETLGLLKGSRPIHWFQAEACALAQVGQELVGSVLMPEEHV